MGFNVISIDLLTLVVFDLGIGRRVGGIGRDEGGTSSVGGSMIRKTTVTLYITCCYF